MSVLLATAAGAQYTGKEDNTSTITMLLILTCYISHIPILTLVPCYTIIYLLCFTAKEEAVRANAFKIGIYTRLYDDNYTIQYYNILYYTILYCTILSTPRASNLYMSKLLVV